MAIVEVKVPDIGDFKDVPVIEVLVKPGDTVKAEDSLVTLESDKATMDVPSPVAGVVKEVKVKVGDKVSRGHAALLTLDSGAAAAPPPRPPQPPAPRSLAAEPWPARPQPRPPPRPRHPQPVRRTGPCRARTRGSADVECEMLVLGSGPGGYSAAFRAADLGMKTVLVERYATLGGVCLNVGCIPSKALLHTAAVMDEVKTMGAHGITLRRAGRSTSTSCADSRTGVVKKLTGGLAGMAKARKVDVVRGIGRFLDAAPSRSAGDVGHRPRTDRPSRRSSGSRRRSSPPAAQR